MHNEKVVISILATDELSDDDLSVNKNLDFLQNNFQDIDLGNSEFVKLSSKRPNSISLTKNWYPRPTHLDLQFEQCVFQTQFFVSFDKIYE